MEKEDLSALKEVAHFSNEQKVVCSLCLSEVNFEDVADFGCNHKNSCNDCTKQLFEACIKEGKIKKLICPHLECNQSAPEHLIQNLVGAEAYDKLQNLHLAQFLANASEIVKCPICTRHIYTGQPKLGYCEHCNFRFCTKCNECFHGIAPCGLGLTYQEQQLYTAKIANAQNVAEKYEITKEAKRWIKERQASLAFIRIRFKTCPNCNISIEKISGCNEMSCIKCGMMFCYACGANLESNPRAHFRGRCAAY